MSEMVERVALAISGGDDAGNILEIHRYRARAAIAAMREPTDRMKRYGAMTMPDHSPIADDAGECWQNMIDEALV